MSGVAGALKPLRWPRFWLALWWLAVAAVVVVCLMPPPPLPELPANADKVEHFLAYLVLAGSAVQVYRPGRPLLWVALGLILMGIAIEGTQGALTRTRAADPMDALANTAGVLAGMALAWTPLRDLLLRCEPTRG